MAAATSYHSMETRWAAWFGDAASPQSVRISSRLGMRNPVGWRGGGSRGVLRPRIPCAKTSIIDVFWWAAGEISRQKPVATQNFESEEMSLRSFQRW